MEGAVYHQFVGAIALEIPQRKRRMRDPGSYYINRSEVEDVGERVGGLVRWPPMCPCLRRAAYG
jgi:hypothetical protein